jgi:mannose-6-phosphate isomerase-like protein (cupin superfamily)
MVQIGIYIGIFVPTSFTLNDEQHAVAQGDTFVIPPGNEYEYQGTMKLFEFNVSPDNVFSDQVTYEKSAQ